MDGFDKCRGAEVQLEPPDLAASHRLHCFITSSNQSKSSRNRGVAGSVLTPPSLCPSVLAQDDEPLIAPWGLLSSLLLLLNAGKVLSRRLAGSTPCQLFPCIWSIGVSVLRCAIFGRGGLPVQPDRKHQPRVKPVSRTGVSHDDRLWV